MKSKDTPTQDHQEKDVDFLHSMQDLELLLADEETSQDVPEAPAAADEAESSVSYTSRKPRWWHRLGQGKPTKGQKKAMQAMQPTHQLPRLAYNTVYDWTSVFGEESTSFPTWLEIGCGTGENLLALAEQNPTKNLIGAEMHASGIGNCFQRIYQATQRQRFFRGYMPYSEDLENELQADTTAE